VDAKTKKVKLTENDMYGIAFARDGKGLATADYAGWVYLWDLSAGKAAWSKKLKAPCIYCVVFSPDGKFLLTGHDNKTIQVTPTSK
jgi:WD40 repeat protein